MLRTTVCKCLLGFSECHSWLQLYMEKIICLGLNIVSFFKDSLRGFENLVLTFLCCFQCLGTVLLDIANSQFSLWVICEALDAIFDTFADGPLVNAVADSIGLLVNLQQLVQVLRSRVSRASKRRH